MNAIDLETDVLIIGGGMAGAWAALGAARAGAQVTLVEKGHCGTSGIAASAGPGHWWVAPEARDAVVRRRAAAGEGLAEPRWMHRILDTTWRQLPTLAPHYEFPVDRSGQPAYRALRGPEYLRALRRRVDEAGVRVLDHSPALELLRHADGSVAGAQGVRLRCGTAGAGGEWRARAGAVVVASGGCAFLSKVLGADNNTGDGTLMAAEAGAELSGMEFTNYYTVAPAHSSMTRSMSYVFARYFDGDGRELDIPAGPGNVPALARALLAGPVTCSLAGMPHDLRDALPTISPNVMLPFTRCGIDPFRDRFAITLRGEGTVRGIGGLRVASDGCETNVTNLFVAGDAASRERVAGAVSGGGNINSAWALSSGWWSGRAAAARARRDGRRADARALPAGQAGLRPRAAPRSSAAAAFDRAAAVAVVQRALLDYDRNIFRSAIGLNASSVALDAVWREIAERAGGVATGDGLSATARLRLRETAALVANARFSVRAALQRHESRGMHQRTDSPATRPEFAHRIVSGGLHEPWHRHEAVERGVDRPEAAEALAS